MARLPLSLARAEGIANGPDLSVMPPPLLGPAGPPDEKPLPRAVLSPSPRSMMPLPRCLLHFSRYKNTNATRAMPATLPTTPPTTAFRVSGASPEGGSGVGSTGAGTGACTPAPPLAESPVPLVAMAGALKRVVEVKRELLLLVEANVEREECEVRVEFEKSASVWLLKNDGVRATKPSQSADGGPWGSAKTHLTKS